MNWDSLGSKSKAMRLGASLLVVAVVSVAVGISVRGHRAAAFKSVPASARASAKPPANLNAQSILASLPIIFEPNVGQAASAAKFVAHGTGYGLAFDNTGATLSLQSSPTVPAEQLHLKLAGANASAPTAIEPLPGRTNYFVGNDPAAWHTKVPQFARVRYQSVYPGIHLVYYGTQGHLEYDFQVEPGADPSLAQLEFSGARHLTLDKDKGDLIIQTSRHSLRFNAPHIYQRDGARTQDVPGHFVLRANHSVGFVVGAYDRSRELVIDPQLSYSTYFGGSGVETSPSVATDGVSIYLAGATTSNNLPVTTGALQATLNGAQNVFVLKLNPAQGAAGILYLTYLGGSGSDSTVGLGVNNGVAYIAGNTTSPNFPTSGTTAYQPVPEAPSTGPQHVFVSVLDALGSTLKYSSYLSGNGNDIASGMTVDNNANIYVTGTTTSTDTAGLTTAFPASTLPEGQAYQGSPRAPLQFFVTKVNTAAAGIGSIAYSTYFGGGTPSTGTAIGGGIAVDGNNNVYFTGTTNFIYTGSSPLTDFPILNAYQPCLDQSPPTTITNPPTCSSTTATANDAFLAKINLNPNGNSQLVFSTYFGGSLDDSSTAVALDSGAANIYITGKTISTDVTVPTSVAAFQKCLNTPVNPIPPAVCPTGTTGTDAYVARFSNPSSGTTSVSNTYFTYFGGSNNESGLAITVDSTSDAYITGPTNSTDLFPDSLTTQNPLFTPIQSTLVGAQNAFIARIDTTTNTSSTNPGNSYVTYFGGNGTDRGTSVVLDSLLNSYFAGDTTSNNFPTLNPLQLHLSGTQDAWVTKLGTSANLSISGVPTYGTGQQNFTDGNPATFTYTLSNSGPDPATNITVTDNFSSQATPLTFNSASLTGGSCSAPTSTAPLVCTLGVLQSGATATMTVSLTPSSGHSFNGGTVTVTYDANPNGNQVVVSAQSTDFSVAVQPAAQTVVAGQSPAVPFVLLITPFQNYGSAIAVTCAVPAAATGVTCAPVSSSVTPGSSPQSVQIKVGTTARPIPTTSLRQRGPMFALWLGLPGVVFLGIGTGGSKRRRRVLSLLALAAIAATFALQPACSSNKTTVPPAGTPTGHYPMVVTATSGSFHQNATFELDVP